MIQQKSLIVYKPDQDIDFVPSHVFQQLQVAVRDANRVYVTYRFFVHNAIVSMFLHRVIDASRLWLNSK